VDVGPGPHVVAAVCVPDDRRASRSTAARLAESGPAGNPFRAIDYPEFAANTASRAPTTSDAARSAT
jgi:hypothetical protein